MKLHLPLSLRSALLAACAFAGYASGAPREAYWIDAHGERHDIPDVVPTLGIENAESFVVQNCVSYTHEMDSYWWQGTIFIEKSQDEEPNKHKEIVTAKNVILANNLVLDEGYYGAGGALTVDFYDESDFSFNDRFQVPYSSPLAHFSFEGCGDIRIVNNGASANVGNDEYDYVYDGYWGEMNAWGGAIEFSGNEGSTIPTSNADGEYYKMVERRSILEFKENDHVYIRGNYVSTGDIYYLNAIDTMDADLAFAATAGKTVECYDGLLVEGILWVNTTHPELRNDRESSYTGSIIISGEYAEQDLTKIKNSAPTFAELDHSRRTIAEAVYVARGVLEIREAEVMAQYDLSYSAVEHESLFYSTAQAEVKLTNASLHTEWGWRNAYYNIYYDVDYDDYYGDMYTKKPRQYGSVTMPNAVFSGSNTIRANYVAAEAGKWTFQVSGANKADALVTLTFDNVHEYDSQIRDATRGFFTTGATFYIHAAGATSGETYKLLELDSTLCDWIGRESITLAGAASGSISKGSGDVYYTIDESGILTLWFNYNSSSAPSQGGNDPLPPSAEQPRPAATLTWNPAANAWSEGAAAGDWSGDAEDLSFHAGDHVIFQSAGEVRLEGAVHPGSITVQGAGDTIFTGENGRLSGQGTLAKEGSGTLEIRTMNPDYKGNIHVTGGTLRIRNSQALGSGSAVEVRNATFDAGGCELAGREIILAKRAGILNAEGVRRVTLAGGAEVSGSYALRNGNMLTVSREGATFEGDFIFGNGTLKLEGGVLSLAQAPGFDSQANTRSVSSPGGTELTVIDLSTWPKSLGRHKLVEMEAAGEVSELFALAGTAKSSYLEYADGALWVNIFRSSLVDDEAFIASLNCNQSAVFAALRAMDAQEEAPQGELANAMDAVLNEEDPAAARALLSRLDGAELATAMTSQMVGNLAHLRRLRANMGSGKRLSNAGKNAAFIVGYDEMNRVDADEGKPGLKRTEWGGAIGFERMVREKSLLGLALSSGSAKVTPTQGERYDEDDMRVDFYALGDYDNGWQSVTSIGLGKHDFSFTRRLPGGYTANADMEGFSLNFRQEVSYTLPINEKSAIQPFFSLEASLNYIGSFTETGAGAACLEGDERTAVASDVTVGARYIREFRAAAGRSGSVHVQAALVFSMGDDETSLDARFTGARGQEFTTSAASHSGVGYNLSVNALYPLTERLYATGAAGALLRSGAKETGASLGLKLHF